MKRYLVFAGHINDTRGGWEDYKGQFDTLEEATSTATADADPTDEGEWYQIVDTQSGEMVDSNYMIQ